MLHAVGDGILFFVVLPHTDSTFATILFPLLGFVPSLLNIRAKLESLAKAKKAGGDSKVKQKLKDFLWTIPAPVSTSK